MTSSPRQLKRSVAALALLALLLGGCGAEPDSSQPVRLGVMVEATGPYASLGVAGRNGMQLAVEQANANGGIHGRPIELLYRNDVSNPEVTQQGINELIAAKVEAILGPMTSKTAVQLIPLATNAGILLMGGTTLSRLLAGHDDQYFRIVRHDNPDAKGIARYLRKRLGLARISVIVEDSNPPYTEPWMLDFNRYLAAEAGEMQPPLHFIRSAQTDYAALAQQLLAQQPQAVVLLTSALDAAMLATQLRQLEPQLPLAGAIWAAEDVLLQLGGRAVEGLVSIQAYDLHDSTPAFSAVRTAYEQRFKAPIDSPAIVGYDATNVVLRALRERQANETLKQTLLRLRKFQGLQYGISLDGFGDIDIDSPVFLKIVRGGQFADVE
ncbi:MAG: ABC transporter substrate-binding protein [Pseudomonas sp.]|uniref:ABC transporter substrate-binding protein n=1 Tax=Pseudomonas sp. TaxID=306 RepID=UPI003BB4B352